MPPAIERGSAETIDRLGILSEHGDCEGVLLWRLVRDVELWSKTPPGARAELFTSQAAESRIAWLRESTFPEPVRTALDSLARLLLTPSDSPPASHEVSAACFEIATWARAAGAKETAVAFAQASALASPHLPRCALLTGVCAEELGQAGRAVTWFQRAVTLARRAEDGSTYSSAYVGLGGLAEAERRMGVAHRAYIRAFQAAGRFGLKAERARAAYRLFRFARGAGNADAASRYAWIVTRATAKGLGPGVPAALDVLDYWTEHRQDTPVRRLLACLSRTEHLKNSERFTLAELRLRAAMAANAPIAAKRAWRSAWAHVEAAPGRRADALLQLAAHAARLQDDDALRQAGKAALVHADPGEFERVHAELRRIGGTRVHFGPTLSGAA